jgi:phosphoribosylanthranilate isomerase
MVNIKVNGITEIKQLKQLDGLNIDFAGLDFNKQSPWYIGGKIAGKELKIADFDIRKVGIFANAEYGEIMKAIDEFDLDGVQLQGDESELLCEQLSDKTEVIKVFNISGLKIALEELIEDYDEVCDYYLFDTASSEVEGGTGKQFDWKVLSKAKIEKPFFLSGGIGVDDIAKVKGFKHPDYYAVDINSKVEKEPGVKDMGLVLQFRQGLK